MNTRTPFRLAIRSEGEVINCYLAPMESMKGAMFLGSLHRTLAREHPEIYEEWKKLMTGALGVMIVSVSQKLGYDIKKEDVATYERDVPVGERKGEA